MTFFAHLACALALLVRAAAPLPYDESGHHAVVYALARLAGYSKAEATQLANAAQSPDENLSMTAFSMERITGSARGLLDTAKGVGRFGTAELKEQLRDLPHMVSGEAFHALTKNRATVERWHVERIERARSEGREDLARLYFGQYLHFVADVVVHPQDPLFGHVLEFHAPDRPEGEKLRVMMRVVSEKLTQYREGALTPCGAEDYAGRAPLDSARESIAVAVENQWRPDCGDELGAVFRRVRSLQLSADLIDAEALLDRERAARAAAKVSEALEQLTGEAEPIELTRIELDANGDPPDAPRSIEHLSLATLVQHGTEFQAERAASAERAMELAFDGAAEAAHRAAACWQPPQGPGGVALDPGLRMPDLGEVLQLTLGADGGVVLDTATGRLPIDGVRARSLATILRTVAAGEIPFVSIGTEPSDRPGYAKVSLSPSLRGTREGALLYRADLQFKAIFADYPLGDALDLNVPGDPIVSGYPGIGGSSMRFWITCAGVELANQDGRLVLGRPGMQIHSETMLMGEPVADPTMAAYAARLTGSWDQLRDRIWEFRAVEELALECALAFWVRDHRVRVNEVVWLLPAVADHTPDDSPIVVRCDPHQQVTGGVTLTPEGQNRAPGRMLLMRMANTLDPRDVGPSSPAWLRWQLGGGILLAMLAIFFAGALLLWWALRRAVAGATFGGAVRLWLRMLSAYALLALVVSPLLLGAWLSMFDRNFVSFLLVALAPPALLWWFVARSAPRLGPWAVALAARGSARLLTSCSYAVPASAGLLGLGGAMLTTAIAGAVPTPALEWGLTALLAPGDAIADALLCGIGKPGGDGGGILPVPRSLVQSVRVFELRAPKLDGEPGPVLHGASSDSLTPWQELQRVTWPASVWIRPGVVHYTPDGTPPYRREAK